MAYQLACVLSMVLMAPVYATMMAEKCRGQSCNDPKFPLIDYADGNCFCSAHPCWDDNGQHHTCAENSGFPFLSMRYTEQGELKCECSVRPQYQNTYIAKVKCAGHSCDSDEFPMLDFVTSEQGNGHGKCICSSHPCDDLEGVKHSCDVSSGYPLMTYREEMVDPGYPLKIKLNKICECKASVSKQPSDKEL